MRHSRRGLKRRYGHSSVGVKFKDLNVGDTFDFVSPNSNLNSFYMSCTKTGPRSYTWQSHHDGSTLKSRVGSANVLVYHVNTENQLPIARTWLIPTPQKRRRSK